MKKRFMQLLSILLLGAGLGFPGLRASEPSPPPALTDLFGGPFQLVDDTGQPKTNRDFLGKFMLLYFGYVNCPAICPARLQEMALALEALGTDAEKITPVFITLDPQRDTSARIKAFLASFGPQFIGLTGTEAQIKTAAKAYKIIRRKVAPPDLDSPGDYLVFHSTLVFLIGPDGKILTLFPINVRGEEMAARLRIYLSG